MLHAANWCFFLYAILRMRSTQAGHSIMCLNISIEINTNNSKKKQHENHSDDVIHTEFPVSDWSIEKKKNKTRIFAQLRRVSIVIQLTRRKCYIFLLYVYVIKRYILFLSNTFCEINIEFWRDIFEIISSTCSSNDILFPFVLLFWFSFTIFLCGLNIKWLVVDGAHSFLHWIDFEMKNTVVSIISSAWWH